MAEQKKAKRSFGAWLKDWMADLIAIGVLLIIMFGICKGTPAILNSVEDSEDTATAAIITMVDVDANLLA